MFKNILLPVDPARPFGAANQYAVDLAHRFGSRIMATYVIDDHLLGPVAEEAATSIDEALEWVGTDAMEDFVRAHQDIDCRKTLAYGSTPTALFQVVLQTGADLVVLGGYHAKANPTVWGSTVVDVVHHAEKPVFVVRESGHLPLAEENIVVPFDGSERPVANLARIAMFARELGCGLDLVHVGRNEEASKSILEKGAWVVQEHGVRVETHMLPASRFRSKAKTILNYAKAQKSPLVALSRLGMASRHTGRSRTVAWLLSHSPIPVWVVRK